MLTRHRRRARAVRVCAAFIEANEIVHVRLADQPRHLLWLQFARQAGLSVNVERGLVFDTAVLAAQYALSGQGIALVDPSLFAEELRSGRLVKPFEAALDDGYGYYLIDARRRSSAIRPSRSSARG